jgi:hypothetical protein
LGRDRLTSLGWTEVLARGWGTRASPTSFLNTEGAAFDDFALQFLSCSVGLIRSDHLDESETTRFLGVWVDHDRTILDFSKLFEHG